MSKKVLVISSSPRKDGNSDILSNEFIKGVSASGNVAEKVALREKKINYCTGCGFCNTNNYTKCSQTDDMSEILDKMQDADVIVFATPVYFYTMCAQLKTFIDRCCSRYTRIQNKEFYYILTAADGNKKALERTVTELGGFLACLDGAVHKGTIFATGVWSKGEVLNTNFVKDAYEMGKSV